MAAHGVASSRLSSVTSLHRRPVSQDFHGISQNPAATSRRHSRLVVRAQEEDDFEARLAKLRKKGGSGTGKKAEERKAKKEGVSFSDSEAGPSASPKPASAAAVESLPPVPLKDPISGGLPVVLGFTPFSERLNGQAAMLGLLALLSIELASGEGVLKYHDGATILVQLYVLAGLGALVVKTQKEKDSVWPQ